MSASVSQADVELLEKLVLGQLPVADVDRLAAELGDDARLAELAESLGNVNDTLLDSLRNHQTLNDFQTDQLVERLMKRLKGASASASAVTATASVDESAATNEPIPENLEYFRIVKVLGQGGMGTVYLADDSRLGRPVALKTLKHELAANPAAKDRFLREARSAARLHHDHIIPIYYVGEANGIPFLAMPYLEGEPLDSRIRREGKHKTLPIPESIRIAREVALGLSVAHAQGLIHRDIKPANIWLEAPTNRAKILDFGLARTEKESANLTASGAIIGTPAYMAPEQARGKAVDARADLFSLGCVLYEMLTGKRPFTGQHTMAILSSLALDHPPAPHTLNPKCPVALSDLTMQLLAKDPAQRPASAELVTKQLARLEMPMVEILDRTEVTPAHNPWSQLDDSISSVPLATPAEPEASAKGTRRKRRLFPYVAVGLLFAFIGVGIAFGGTIIRVVNNEGELIVEVDDPNTEVAVKDGGVEIRREENGKKRVFLVKAGKDGEVEVREPGSDTVLVMEKFKLTRAGKAVVTVTAAKLAAGRKDNDPDRKAAEYVLSIGGHTRLRVNGIQADPEAIGELPRGPFELRIVDLVQNAKASDDGLANFKDCKDLTHLFLNGTQIGDRGLAHLQSCKNLNVLHVKKTKVTVQGIAELKKALPNIKIESDDGAIEPKQSPDPERTVAEWAQRHGAHMSVTSGEDRVGLEPGQRLPEGLLRLIGIYFHDPAKAPTEADLLANLRGLTGLDVLVINSPLTDAGLGRLVALPALASTMQLSLRNTKLSAAGLAHLERLPKLNRLQLGEANITDAELVPVKKLKGLRHLDLTESGVTGAGLAELRALENLERLQLDGSRGITDTGLKHLVGRPRLTFLGLQRTSVTDTGMATLADWTQLTGLDLVGTDVTDAGVARLRGLTKLEALAMRSTKVTDAGLAHLTGLTKLVDLELLSTKVTADGVKKLAAALPQCKIAWDGGVIEQQKTSEYKNSLGMLFSLVPKGKSWLGGGGGKPGDKEVEFKDDFYIGTIPITQEEWEKVTGTNPAHFSRNGFRKNDVKDIPDADLKRFPVEGVSYADVQSFLAKLNERDKQAGWEYRLPTMAEWEYACRGGPIDKAESAFLFYAGKPSNTLPPDKANYAYKGGPNRTVKVGQYEPNKLGLYDMHGLVLEWCSDAGKNAIGEDTRMACGGSWNDFAGTASSHIPFLPTVRYASLGLRVVRARVDGPDKK